MSIMRFESTLRSANHPDKTYEGGRDVHWAYVHTFPEIPFQITNIQSHHSLGL
jgi:hypothetical protein